MAEPKPTRRVSASPAPLSPARRSYRLKPLWSAGNWRLISPMCPRIRKGRRAPAPPSFPARGAHSADLSDHRAGAGVARIGRVAGVGLDEDNVDGVARDRRAGLADRTRDDHRHERGQRPRRRRRAVARRRRPARAACDRGRRLLEALERGRCGPAGQAIPLPPLRTPEGDRGADGGVVVADDEVATACDDAEDERRRRRAVVARIGVGLVADPPFGIAPRLHVTVPEHVPWLGVAETSVSPAGSGSFTVTLVASAGPPFETAIE